MSFAVKLFTSCSSAPVTSFLRSSSRPALLGMSNNYSAQLPDLRLTACSKTIHVLPAAPLNTKQTAALARAFKKAAQKYSLGQNWVAISPYTRSLDNKTMSTLIDASIVQEEYLYSGEGLTLLGMDLCFELKIRLAGMTKDVISKHAMAEAVILLRRFINKHKGRPLPARYLRRSYPSVVATVSDQVLLALDDEYEAVFFHAGVAGVNAEQSAWRREGKDWTEEMEQYTRHLSLVKKRSICSFVSDDSDISLCSDDLSECNADLAAIWDQHGVFI